MTKTLLHHHRIGRAAATFGLLSTLAVGCGNLGNYSNDDVDFQLAIPEREDMAANLTTQQATVVGNPAEYLVTTRQVVTQFNALIDALVGIVDGVRALTPTERNGNVRVWGPFPQQSDPRWEARMRLVLGADAASPTGRSFAYAFEYHRVGTDPTTWAALITGRMVPGAGVRHGQGAIALAIGAARTAGYPVTGFENLDTLAIDYQRGNYPITVSMTSVNVATADSPGGKYSYSEDADGSGAMTFEWRTRDNVLVQAVGITSRWLPGGAGRADARVTEGLAATGNDRGIDCWAADGHATYVRRDFENPRREQGDPATCVLPPLP